MILLCYAASSSADFDWVAKHDQWQNLANFLEETIMHYIGIY